MNATQRPKPKVGDTLYRKIWQLLIPGCEMVVVAKVGRKFFTVEDHTGWATTHHVDDWSEKTDGYASHTSLYTSKRAFEELLEREDLRRKIHKAFDRDPGLSLEQLRAIYRMMEEAG